MKSITVDFVCRYGLTKSEEPITNDPDFCFAKILSEQRIEIESKLMKEENGVEEKIANKSEEKADKSNPVEDEKIEPTDETENVVTENEKAIETNGVKEAPKEECEEQNDVDKTVEQKEEKEKELTIERIMSGPAITIVTAWPKVSPSGCACIGIQCIYRRGC